MDELDEFFRGRTIGYNKFTGWTWRGPGYDEGWEDVSKEDVSRLRDLLGPLC